MIFLIGFLIGSCITIIILLAISNYQSKKFQKEMKEVIKKINDDMNKF